MYSCVDIGRYGRLVKPYGSSAIGITLILNNCKSIIYNEFFYLKICKYEHS